TAPAVRVTRSARAKAERGVACGLGKLQHRPPLRTAAAGGCQCSVDARATTGPIALSSRGQNRPGTPRCLGAALLAVDGPDADGLPRDGHVARAGALRRSFFFSRGARAMRVSLHSVRGAATSMLEYVPATMP